MDTRALKGRAEARRSEMTANIRTLPSQATSASTRQAPVRVSLRRKSSNLARAHPPDGEGKVWWTRLKKAMGTSSSDFVNDSLIQLQAAARLPGGGISEMAVNSALALVEAVAPRDEVEGALAVQMACTHTAAMAILGKWDAYSRLQSVSLGPPLAEAHLQTPPAGTLGASPAACSYECRQSVIR
jgi:hypothetical protein